MHKIFKCIFDDVTLFTGKGEINIFSLVYVLIFDVNTNVNTNETCLYIYVICVYTNKTIEDRLLSLMFLT